VDGRDVVSPARDTPRASSAAAPQSDLAPLILDRKSATLFPREVETPTHGDTVGNDAPAQMGFEVETDSADDTQTLEAAGVDPAAPTVEAAVHATQVLEQSNDRDIDWAPTFDDTPDAHAANHAAGLSLEERIAELESAVELQSKNWEADGSDDFDDDAPKAFPQVLVHSSARVLNFRSASLAQPADTEYSFETETETDNAALVDQFEFSDETASDDALGDSDSDVAALGEKTSLEDDSLEPLQASKPALDAAPSAAPLGAVTTDDDDDLALAGYSADEMLDKGALRDMIAEVIREELQGVLGERITSNVRRLVRREVQRALTLREFD
jgi:hypothetical protein